VSLAVLNLTLLLHRPRAPSDDSPHHQTTSKISSKTHISQPLADRDTAVAAWPPSNPSRLEYYAGSHSQPKPLGRPQSCTPCVPSMGCIAVTTDTTTQDMRQVLSHSSTQHLFAIAYCGRLGYHCMVWTFHLLDAAGGFRTVKGFWNDIDTL
jgi:hypothetical protein